MRKLIALMKARCDIPPATVRRMYEEEHAPLVMRLMPMIQDYRRNYFDRVTTQLAPDAAWPDFDIVTELWFAEAADLALFISRMADGEEGRRLRADSARFLVSGSTRLLRVHEQVSPRS